MDSTKYIDIPFKANGRDRSGVDCWGLVCLIYKEEYNIILPSFSTEYHIEDDLRINELFAQYREGWQEKETPEAGDLVLFRIFGEQTHVGVMLNGQQFIHTREGSNCVVDHLTLSKWKNRVSGFFKYVPQNSVVLNSAPHPLKTERFTDYLPEGTNLEEIYEILNKKYAINPELNKSITIMVNGIPVPRHLWLTTKLTKHDTVEYRAVAGKETVKMVALIALSIYAPYIAGALEAGLTAATISGASVTGSMAATWAAATTGSLLTQAAVVLAGSYLINAISPIRPPSSEDPGTPDPQYLLTGGNNPYNPYGAIPVVLGKVRLTPPLGAKTFVTYPTERENYLNMLLVWGYGPLTIDQDTIRIGEVDWDEYQYNTGMPGNGRITLDRKTAVTQQQQDQFDEIYGNDVTQLYSGLELFGDGVSGELTTSGSGQTYTYPILSGTSVTFDIKTGEVYTPPTELVPEVATIST